MRRWTIALMIGLGLTAAAATRIEKIDPVAAGELRLRPTFVACGVTYGSSSANLALRYRRAGSGESWRIESRFPAFPEVANCRGSLLDLEEDTEYEVAVCQGDLPLKTARFRTWKTDVPIAETRVIDPNTKVFPIVISAQGTADGWIRYTLPEGTALTNLSPAVTLAVGGARNVIVENVTIVGGGNRLDRSAGNGVVVTNSVGVRFLNCDISNWGRVGTPRFEDTGRRHVTDVPTKGYGISQDAGIRIGTGAQEIVVERCFIHDPRGTANSWYYSHPAGQDAIMMSTPDHSTVIRWCDLCGNEDHRYDDVIASGSNFDEIGGFNRDADVYGNYMAFASDDVIEFDGGQQNLRLFDNRCELCFVGASLQGCMVSPSYVFRNLFSGLTDAFSLSGQTVKTGSNGSTPEGQDARMYVWDNVMMGRGSGMSMRPYLIEDVCNNVLYDKAGIGDAAGGAPGSVATNNVNRGASTDRTADPAWPKRALPFNFDRTRFTGIRFWDGRLVPPVSSGAVDVGAAVFRYDGPADAVLTCPFTNTCPTAASTNSVETFDLRRDVTFAASVSSGCLPFAKTGPGRMILRGDSTATDYGFALGQPGTDYAKLGNFNKQFVLPADGQRASQGFSMFSLLDGGIDLVCGTLRVRKSKSYVLLGGWTAAAGEQEPDVAFVVRRQGTVSASSTTVVGSRHGLTTNTPRGPARAELLIDGGKFDVSAGQVFHLGSIADAPAGTDFNGVAAVCVKNGGLFTRNNGGGTANPFYVPQHKGQRAEITVDGGQFSPWRLLIGASATADDSTAAVDIHVFNGGLFDADSLTNNVSGVANPAPVRVRVTNGGLFFVNDVQNRGSGRLSLAFDNGVVGCNTLPNRKFKSARCEVIGPNMTSVTVGPGGLTVRARGRLVSDEPQVAVIASPLEAASETEACGVTIDADEGNVVEFAAVPAYEVPLAVRGGGVSLPAGMRVRFDVPEGETRTVAGTILGHGTLVKTGKGLLRFAGAVTADVFRVCNGNVAFDVQPSLGKLDIVNGGVRTATWTDGAGDGLMSSAANWDVADPVLTDGSLDIRIGTAGTQMIPGEGTLVNSITLARDITTPFVIGAPGRTLGVVGRIDLGAGADDTAQVILRGRLTGPCALDQGAAGKSATLPILAVTAPSYTAAAVPAGCIGGETKSLPLVLDNAEVDKPVYLHSAPTNMNHTALRTLKGTTNVISGNVYWPSPTGYITTEEDSELTLSGGVNAAWGHTKNGTGTLRLVGKPYTCRYQLVQNGGTVVFDAEGCTFGGRDHTEGFVVNAPKNASCRVEFLRSGCFADSKTSFVLGGNGATVVDFHATTQRIGRVKNWTPSNAGCRVCGETGALLEVTGGVRSGMELKMYDQVMMMTNSVQVSGGLSLAFRGDLAETTNTTYTGLNESFVLAGRDFESGGDLLVSGGTLELAANATWLNGTNFVASGRGVLRFSRRGQVSEERSVLWLSDEGTVWIPEGTTVQVGRAWVRASPSEKWRSVSPGTYDARAIGRMRNRVIGGGTLRVFDGAGSVVFLK